jgi:hypothetical protein
MNFMSPSRLPQPSLIPKIAPISLALGFIAIGWPVTLYAEPARLVCEGEMRLQSANGETAESYALSLAIDQIAGTVAVGSFGTAPIISEPDAETVVIIAKPGPIDSVSSGTINRFTGMASIHIIGPDGLLKFYGRCKPAARMF